MIQILCIYPDYKPEIFNHFTKWEEIDSFMKGRPENCPVYEINIDDTGHATIGKQIKAI